MYGAPVTRPMVIPAEVYSSPYGPEYPALNELPEMVDAKAAGLRLQGTLAKALPGITEAGSMTNAREMEIQKFADEMAYVFDITKYQQAVSKARARQLDRQLESASKSRNKSTGKRASAASRRNARYKKGASYNAAYAYGYDPNRAMM